jgi:hypothetical protein
MDVEREEAPHHRRKDRRRWCRGKPGVEHVLAHGEYIGAAVPGDYSWDLHTDRCETCGRKFLFKGTACRAQAIAPST